MTLPVPAVKEHVGDSFSSTGIQNEKTVQDLSVFIRKLLRRYTETDIHSFRTRKINFRQLEYTFSRMRTKFVKWP